MIEVVAMRGGAEPEGSALKMRRLSPGAPDIPNSLKAMMAEIEAMSGGVYKGASQVGVTYQTWRRWRRSPEKITPQGVTALKNAWFRLKMETILAGLHRFSDESLSGSED